MGVFKKYILMFRVVLSGIYFKVSNELKIIFSNFYLIAPKNVILNIESACNMSCHYCFQQYSRAVEPRMSLTLENAKKIESKIGVGRVKPALTILGGEPTLNPEFVQIVKYFNQNKYNINILTNGLMIDEFFSELKPQNKNKIVFSISIHDPNYQNYLEKLKIFNDLYRCKNYYLILSVTINYLFENSIKLADFIHFFENSGIKQITFLNSLDALDIGCKRGFGEFISQLGELKKMQFKIPILFYPWVKQKDLQAFYTDALFPALSKKCFYPWQTMQILPNGIVVLCPESGILGNIFEDEFSLFSGERALSFRRRLRRQGACYHWCRRCCFRMFF